MVNYEKVPNIIYDLGIDPEEVYKSEEDENHLTFSFQSGDNSYDTKFKPYIDKLEKLGFELTLYDATLSQTFEFIGKDYNISITVTSVEENKTKEINNNSKEPSEEYIFKIYRIDSK